MVNPQIATVVLLSGPDDQLVRYTSALQQLEDANIGTHAIIGGCGDASPRERPPRH